MLLQSHVRFTFQTARNGPIDVLILTELSDTPGIQSHSLVRELSIKACLAVHFTVVDTFIGDRSSAKAYLAVAVGVYLTSQVIEVI